MKTGGYWKQAPKSVVLFAGLSFGLFVPVWAAPRSAPTTSLTNVDEIVARIALADSQKHLNLEQFTVIRRYVLKNSRMSQNAVMKVRWSYQKERGKSFQVIESEGAEGISKRVLERVMEGEAESGTPQQRENSRLSAEHYNFRLIGMDQVRGKPCYILELRPRLKSRFLLNGKAWIDAQDFSPVRVEGRPSASFSFFVGKPYIVQEFQKVGNFYMASYNHSRSESHIIGDSELTIEYSDYDVRSIEGTRVALRQCASRASLN